MYTKLNNNNNLYYMKYKKYKKKYELKRKSLVGGTDVYNLANLPKISVMFFSKKENIFTTNNSTNLPDFLFPTYQCISINTVTAVNPDNGNLTLVKEDVNTLAKQDILNKIENLIIEHKIVIMVQLNRDKAICNKIINILVSHIANPTQTLFRYTNMTQINIEFKKVINPQPPQSLQVIYLPANIETFVVDIKHYLDSLPREELILLQLEETRTLENGETMKKWFNNFYKLLLDSIYHLYEPYIIKLFPKIILNDINFLIDCFNSQIDEPDSFPFFRFKLSKFYFILLNIEISNEDQLKILQFLNDNLFKYKLQSDEYISQYFQFDLTEDKFKQFMTTISTYANNVYNLKNNTFTKEQFNLLQTKIELYKQRYYSTMDISYDEQLEISKYEKYITFCLDKINSSSNP